jgi:hypothetical protein
VVSSPTDHEFAEAPWSRVAVHPTAFSFGSSPVLFENIRTRERGAEASEGTLLQVDDSQSTLEEIPGCGRE